MRPFITFIGFVIIIPGWTLIRAGLSDTTNPDFSTPSGAILWALVGNPHDIGLIHLYGLATIILGITVVIYGLLATPKDQEALAPLTQ